MALSKQIHLYLIDTASFYNEAEYEIHKNMNKLYIFIYLIEKALKNKKIDEYKKENARIYLQMHKRRLKALKDSLKNEFKKRHPLRDLRTDDLIDKKIVSVFESSLTRCMGLYPDEVTKDIFIVKTYYYDILKDLVEEGFTFNGEKYVILTASAGQIRTKKTVFIKESLWKEYRKTLMCGLTEERISEINSNKYLAYLALSNSATDKWAKFDIDRAIVVEDMELNTRGIVDYIDTKTFEITRKEMDVPISHTDGCGMVLPIATKKNFMVRLPWVKGLVVSFPYDKFIKENKCNGKIKDIYGKEYDIIEDNIQVIFTKSQFKMWSYYKSWDEYKKFYKEYNCEASFCNLEPDYFKKSKISYQMLQSLNDITDEEMKELAKKTNETIRQVGKDRKTMLKLLGLNKASENKSHLQTAVELYPEILTDKYTKEVIKDVKKSFLKNAYAGKLEVDGHYTFVSPDMYAFCEWLFLGVEKPNGLLEDGEVSCALYEDGRRLDCLRSPSLMVEHGLRNNRINDDTKKWFTTNAVYISYKDLISKILQCDFDGDMLLVCGDENLVKVAERNMRDVVPLYYEMAKAGKTKLNKKSIYEGLINSYSGGNIGWYSNNISKIHNAEDRNLEVIKVLCCLNNFVIDYAKTLFMPDVPNHIQKSIIQCTKGKLPHYFMYAKDKTKEQVEKINNIGVNKLKKSIIKDVRINFQLEGDFDYTKLMFHDDVKIGSNSAKEIIDIYRKLDLKKRYILTEDKDDGKYNSYKYAYQKIRREILEVNPNILYVVDVLVKFLYSHRNSKFKTTLWECFGDVICGNIQRNVEVKYKYCEVCGDLIEDTVHNKKYCDICFKEKELNRQRLKWHKNKGKYKKLP
jgi:arsenate reductase-like glutaredoxin family protein